MDGLKAVNVYVIETEDGLTLVDGGWAVEASRKQLEDSLRKIGHHPRDITSFLVTHVHRDHYTQAAAIRSEFGTAAVSLGRGERPALELIRDPDRAERSTESQLRRAGADELADRWRAASEGAERDLTHWTLPDQWLDDDQRIQVGTRTLEAVATPGHTRGHFVFVDRAAGVLFAGDHVLPTITPSIGFEPVQGMLPLGDFLSSLLRVRDLPDLRLAPAHGAADRRSHERVDELLAHHDHRLALCLAAVSPSGATALDVARAVTWTRRERHFDELDGFNAGLATLESKAHLDLLVARGTLTADTSDVATIYRPVPPPPAAGQR
ncbi:MBL fold metallo-hydrolase [Phytohabitans sp. ZYX-F-186]|uniref:MBL fold metallo-hydrolase n=1 Tax=Phytohabitans maris TaxID=3071409 RepID=A0ABU0ZNB6_9ACTN|nr:MBL fold metallo-hydrolase [Phytohabitans sp. ZYX-F-186]MDQ7908531.1 MBL fold metallo-hydrolase [Phytohabitans sp. ZYX-F-186]